MSGCIIRLTVTFLNYAYSIKTTQLFIPRIFICVGATCVPAHNNGRGCFVKSLEGPFGRLYVEVCVFTENAFKISYKTGNLFFVYILIISLTCH